MRLFWITLIYCQLAGSEAVAGQDSAIDLNDLNGPLNLGSRFEYMVDHVGDLDIEQVRGNEQGFIWQKAGRDLPGFGFTPDVYWVRMELAPTKSVGNYLLTLDHPLMDDVRFYSWSDGKPLETFHMGDMFPFDHRPVDSRLLSLPLNLEAGKSTRIYLRFASANSMVLGMKIWKVADFWKWESNFRTLQGFLLGIIAIIALYNLFIFLVTRVRVFLYYSLMVIGILLGRMQVQGLAYQLLFPDYPSIQQWSGPVLISLTSCAAIWFCREFLIGQEPQRHFLSDLIYKMLLIVSASVLGVVLLFGYAETIRSFSGISVLTLVILSVLVLFNCKWRDVTHQIFVMTWMMVWASVAFAAMQLSGVIKGNHQQYQLLELSFVLTVLLHSLALGLRIRRWRREREEALGQVAHSRVLADEARIVQEALLEHPELISGVEIATHYKSAEAVGGDLYDFYHDRQKNRLYLFVGDVSGHGMASALVMGAASGAIRATLRALSEFDLDSDEVLQRVAARANEVVRMTGRNLERWMTMVFVCVDLNDLTGTYLNAGHNQIITFGEGKVGQILRAGSVLGSVSKARFGLKKFQLQPEGGFLIYTDGLLENQGNSKEKMTTKQLMGIVQRGGDPQSLLDQILNEANENWQGEPGEDDCTILVVRITEKGQTLTGS